MKVAEGFILLMESIFGENCFGGFKIIILNENHYHIIGRQNFGLGLENRVNFLFISKN